MGFNRGFSKILDIGVSDNFSVQENIRVRLTNQIVTTGTFLTILNALLNLVKGEMTTVLVSVLVVLIFGVVFFLVHRGFHTVARVSLLVMIISLVSTLQVLYGDKLKLEPVYLVFLVGGIITFETKKMKMLSFFFVIVAYCIGFFSDPDWAIFSDRVSGFANPIYFMFSGFLMYWIVSTLLKSHNIQSQQLNKQALGLKEVVNSTAHNLRTPVNNVINLTQLVGMKIDINNAKPEVKEYFSLLDQSAKDINVRLDDLKNKVIDQALNELAK